MKTYTINNRSYIPSQDLNSLTRSYETLEQGHLKAIETAGNLKTAMAQLDLNPVEEDFRQSKINEIKDTIDANTIYGNAYYALDDIIAKMGDINSDPELLGRLNAQKAYKENIAAIDARQDLTDDVKEFAKEQSPYYYRDKETGELINNGVWKPGYNPVKSYDVNEVLRIVSQYASPDLGIGQAVTFLDINGNPTSEYTPGQTLGVLNTTTGKWEKLSPEKIKSAWDAALNANPGIKASLVQDFNVGKWKYNKTGFDEYNVVNKDGTTKTFNQYIGDIINPFIKAKSYYNRISTTDYENATIKAYNDALASRSQIETPAEQPIPQIDVLTPGNPIQVTNDTVTKTSERIAFSNNRFKSNVANYLSNTGYTIDLNKLDLNNRDKTYTALKDFGLPEQDIQVLMKEFDREADLTYADRKFYNDTLNSMSDRAKAARAITDAMISGIDLDMSQQTDNPIYQKWVKQYSGIIDNIYHNDNFYTGFKDSKSYNEVITKLGGVSAAKELGFKLEQIDGKYYIGLDKENSNQTYKLIDAIRQVYDSSTFGFKVADFFKNIINYYYKDSEGNIQRTFSRDSNQTPDYARDLLNFYDTRSKISINNTPTNLQDLVVETEIGAGATPEENYYRTAASSALDSKVQTLYQNNAKNLDEQVRTRLATAGIINTNVMMLSDDKKDGNMTMKNANTKEVKEMTQFLQNEENVKKISTGLYKDALGNYKTIVTIPVKDDKPYKILLDSITTPGFEAIRNNPEKIAIEQMYKSSASNKAEQIGFYTDDLGNKKHIMLYPANNGNNDFYIGYNDDIDDSTIISFDNAVALKNFYNSAINLKNIGYSPEEFAARRNEYINLLNVFINGYKDEKGNVIPPVIGFLPDYGSTNYSDIIDEIIGL